MTHALSSTYVTLNIIGSVPELMKASLALYSAARIELDNGMWLLGLTPVDRYVLHPFLGEAANVEYLGCESITGNRKINSRMRGGILCLYAHPHSLHSTFTQINEYAEVSYSGHLKGDILLQGNTIPL
jgi:hypothetical protein